MTVDGLDDPSYRQQVGLALKSWVASDQGNVMRFLQSVPVFSGYTSWQTNSLSGIQKSLSQHWSATPGEGIASLCRTAEHLLVNLGLHLQWQNDLAAYTLIPILEWLKEHDQLGGIGQGLLAGLIKNNEKGVGPKDEPNGPESGALASPSPADED